ncbi:MAG TPA: hypothetical protein VGL42_06045 [Opitutaceae bacterium]|jgi:hypothetical protein
MKPKTRSLFAGLVAASVCAIPAFGTTAGVTFHAVDLTVYNHTQNEPVQSLDIFGGLPGEAPDAASTLALLTGGLVMLLAACPKARQAF